MTSTPTALAELRLPGLFEARGELLEAVRAVQSGEMEVAGIQPTLAAFARTWLRAVTEYDDFVASGGSPHWRVVLLTASMHAIHAAITSLLNNTEPFSSGRRDAYEIVSSTSAALREYHEARPADDPDCKRPSTAIALFSVYYWQGLQVVMLGDENGSLANVSPAKIHEHASFQLLGLGATARTLSGFLASECVDDEAAIELALWVSSLIALSAQLMEQAESRQAALPRRDAREGVRGLLDLDFLSRVARRDIDLLAGLRSVRDADSLFEQQLALLLTSIGFVTVPAERATRGVDLICFGHPAAKNEFAFLLEAKSSAKNYSLPTDDERALREYVVRVRARLDRPDDIRFLVIVSASPSRTLEAKLLSLQADLRMPVRYLNADALVALRRALPAHVPMDPFREAVLQSAACIVPDDFWLPVVAGYNDYARHRIEMTRSLLGGV